MSHPSTVADEWSRELALIDAEILRLQKRRAEVVSNQERYDPAKIAKEIVRDAFKELVCNSR